VCADDRAIDDGAGLVDFNLKLFEDGFPALLAGPVGESIVDALPGAEPLGQIAPGQTGLCPMKDGFDEESVAENGPRSLLLSRKHALQAGPLIVGQCVTMHPCL
jgi:hypothetical protein